MHSKFPQFSVRQERNRRTVWTGEWLPSDLSATYTVQINWVTGTRPKIALLSPRLRIAREQMKLPHTYGGQHDICVHQPHEWHAGLAIAETLLPWISQWLFFYEIWAVSGHWLGKGTHPELPQHAEGQTLTRQRRVAAVVQDGIALAGASLRGFEPLLG